MSNEVRGIRSTAPSFVEIGVLQAACSVFPPIGSSHMMEKAALIGAQVMDQPLGYMATGHRSCSRSLSTSCINTILFLSCWQVHTGRSSCGRAAVLCFQDGSDCASTSTGLYIHGSVGSGKSLLMDMFFRVLHQHNAVPRRRRVHFNAAMLEVTFCISMWHAKIVKTLHLC